LKEFWNELSYQEKIKYIALTVAGLIVLLFAIFNWQSTVLHLIFGKVEVPLTILILVSMLGGYAFAGLSNFKKHRKKDKEIKSLKKKIQRGKSSARTDKKESSTSKEESNEK